MKFLLFLFMINLAHAATPRTVFVQLFEWPWSDIARECEENLGPNGFAAVQVSPPQEHLSLGQSFWWERYQPISYKIHSRSGTEAQFIDMVKRCNASHVDVYVDAVINHMAGYPEGIGFAGSKFSHYQYTQYSFNDFHHCGRNGDDSIKNFEDLYELQFCELISLADLKTEAPKVQDSIAAYLNKLISIGVKGFRIDAAKHMPAKDISAIMKKLNKQVYIVQEVIAEIGKGPVKIEDYTKVGDVTAYNYPYVLGQAFKNKRFDILANLKNYFPDSMDSVVFIDNHDLQRLEDRSGLLSANYDKEVFDLAQIFMLTYPFGYPQLYSGYKFKNFDDGPPVDSRLMTLPMLEGGECKAPFICEHKRDYVNALVNFRNKTDKNFVVSNWWTNGRDQLAFSRGNAGFVAINNSDRVLALSFLTGLPPGEYCNILNDKCDNKTIVDQKGFARAVVPKMNALVLMP